MLAGPPEVVRGPGGATGDGVGTRPSTAGRTGTWALLRRHGWSWQQPACRAIERDDAAEELWKKNMSPRVKAQRWPPGAWMVPEDEAGQSMRPRVPGPRAGQAAPQWCGLTAGARGWAGRTAGI
ncbi:winged helix-turn-helix domain-containing protein [Streptomyces canus]